ncbi:hypothetical protein DTO013E5_9117 [Penicillium roqueforti]|nr:hypothetical protein CBS147355_4829 [Penicillium roqueforti]KAI2686821.1 hypothetical protein LCP963914a_4421 [Penicillium roqueforti]KAI2704192.1 hypothetical protein CBS147372_2661 [Penicillium roqueforti]KAI2735943.1 hypothetical protein DTO012A1_8764 [Penicillium roqueforti]KAI2744997.1 hypothetical protein DTO013F2_7592 [Penicillium roqueforti]
MSLWNSYHTYLGWQTIFRTFTGGMRDICQGKFCTIFTNTVPKQVSTLLARKLHYHVKLEAAFQDAAS